MLVKYKMDLEPFGRLDTPYVHFGIVLASLQVEMVLLDHCRHSPFSGCILRSDICDLDIGMVRGRLAAVSCFGGSS